MGIFLSGPAFILYALIAAWFWHQSEIVDAIKAHNQKATAERQAYVSDLLVGISDREAKRQAEASAERSRIAVTTEALIKGVPSYVTKFADTRCVVPVGFVQHFNAAWGLSALPAASSELIDKPSGVLLSDIERANTCNAGAAVSDRAEVRKWREWYAENKPKYDALARGDGGKPGSLPQPKKGE